MALAPVRVRLRVGRALNPQPPPQPGHRGAARRAGPGAA